MRNAFDHYDLGHIDLTADDDDMAIDRERDAVQDNREADAINHGWGPQHFDRRVLERHGWINHEIFPEPPPFVWVEPPYETGDRLGVADDDEWLDAAAYDRVLAANRERENDIRNQQARTNDDGAWDFHEIRLPSIPNEWGINDNGPGAETTDSWGDGVHNARANGQEHIMDTQWAFVAEAWGLPVHGQAANAGRASKRRRNAANRRRANAAAIAQTNSTVEGAQPPDTPRLWEVGG